MKSCKDWIEEMLKEKLICDTFEDKLAVATVLGALKFGKRKRKIIKWINESTELLKTPQKRKMFEKFWNNLKDCFDGSQLYLFPGDEKQVTVEFLLLVCVAQGYIKKTKFKRGRQNG